MPLLLLLVLALPAADSLPAVADSLAGHVIVLSVDDGYRSVYENVYPLLKRYGMTITLGVIADNVTGQSPGYRPGATFMTQSEIQEMIDSCDIEVASHTLSHPWLTRLSPEAAWREIHRSKLVLESLFDQPVVTFVYPYGDMNQAIRDMVREAGYKLGRAVRPGPVDIWADPYRIPEFELRRETSLEAAKAHIRSHRLSVILLHRIVERPQVFTEWPVRDFGRLLEWIHQSGGTTATLGDLYYDYWRRELVRKMIAVAGPIRPDRLFQQIDVDATRTSHPR
ncbi:MAG: polysaccharide deacetylase family protein [candidate division WOR-3 bacterium]